MPAWVIRIGATRDATAATAPLGPRAAWAEVSAHDLMEPGAWARQPRLREAQAEDSPLRV